MSNDKWNVRTVDLGAQWGVRFNVGHQSFTLDFRTELLEEAEWMRDQMVVAVNRLLSPINRKKVGDENS